MDNIRLDEAKAGMVLAQDVKGRFGRGLLSAGNIITDKHLRIFRAWGVTEIYVNASPLAEKDASSLSAQPLHQYSPIEKNIRHMFKFNDVKHPAVRELFQIAMKRKIQPQSPGKS